MSFDLNSLLLIFIPLFVAIDVPGVLPVSAAFLFGGRSVFNNVVGEVGSKAIAKVAALFVAPSP